MAFEVKIVGVDELAKRQFVTKILIERRVHDHTRAEITMQWDEFHRYPERHTADLAAKLLNCTVDITWKDGDLAESVDCFHGYIEEVSGLRNAACSTLVIECVSFSKRTDLIPRYRAFQACKLLDICQQVAKTEPLFKIQTSDDLNFDIDLSLQYGETDFAYLSRMLHAWGIPLSINDKTGEVMLGARGSESSGKFPDINFGWKQVEFRGALKALPKREGGTSGPSAQTRGQVGKFNDQLKPKASDYYPIVDSKDIRERVSSVNSQVDTSCYHLTLNDGVLPFTPGQVVKFENNDHLIRGARIEGHPCETTATQIFELQQFTLPHFPERRVPQWPSRAVWAWVMENENDPGQEGRIQVKFDFEPLDPPSSSDRAWLHTLTPYGGGKSPSGDKVGEYNGLYSLPEVGERVLVEFLGDWDSEAVVIGCVRHAAVNPMYSAKDTKRWRTPSGNEFTMTTKGSQEFVRIKTKDKLMFQGLIDGSNQSVTMICGDSESDMIHYQKSGGPGKLLVACSGDIYLKADQKIQIEGMSVQIKATGGDVRIDGMPNAFINCGPMSMSPASLNKPDEKTLATKSKQRALPQPVGTKSQQQTDPNKKKTWIEIVLKDNQGHPVPGERFRIKLKDGSIREGQLDGDGRARVDGIDPGTAQVSFPDIDANEWKPA